MKPGSSIFFKAMILVLTAALTLALRLPVTAATSSTTLTTTVPQTLPLLLKVSGSGTVTINGVAYAQSVRIEIPRNEKIELQIIPQKSSEIAGVFYNGRDCTVDIKNGNISFPAIAGEAILHVVFSEIVLPPKTGDHCSLQFSLLIMLLLLLGIIVVSSFKKKRN